MSGIGFGDRNRISRFTVTPVHGAQFDKPRTSPEPHSQVTTKDTPQEGSKPGLEAPLAKQSTQAQEAALAAKIEIVLPEARAVWETAKSELTQRRPDLWSLDEKDGIALALMAMNYKSPNGLAQQQSAALRKIPTGEIMDGYRGVMYQAPGDRGIVLAALRRALDMRQSNDDK